MQIDVRETMLPDGADFDEVVLAQMMENAEGAPEPTAGSRVVNDGKDEDAPVPMVLGPVASAGYVYVWDRRTGQPSRVNRNMLPAQLKKRDPETGKLVFTHVKPMNVPPPGGTTACFLHASRREGWMDRAGLPTCRKTNLTSEYQAEEHAKHRHKSEWAAIRKQRDDEDRREERAMRRALVDMYEQRIADSAVRAAPEPVSSAPEDRMAAAASAVRSKRADTA